MIVCNLLFIPYVHAENATFYEGEYINGIYMSKYNPANKTIYYQKARFFRKSGTNEFAYCIEPFQMFDGNNIYEETDIPYNLSEAQKNRIAKIAHYGYGYQNHTEEKWYAITQLMIWQIADPSGDYYFTDYSNGNRITPYNAEIDEINALVDTPTIIPKEINQEYTIVEDQPFLIEVTSTNLLGFTTDSTDITIGENTVLIPALKKGTYEYSFSKKDNSFSSPLVFYQSNNSQNLLKSGYSEIIETLLKINVLSTKLEIYKIDQDTQGITPTGEATLDDAIYGLYTKDGKEIQELVIKNNKATIHNLAFGTYYLQEKEPGKGYTLNSQKIEITISKEKPIIQQVVQNKVIEKKIIIQKEYGIDNQFQKEPNISFEIRNEENEVVETITTNEEGKAETTLPYGTYTIYQKNSTEGYTKVEPFSIEVFNQEVEEFTLRDLEIPVPNTKTSFFSWILILLREIFLC